MESVDFLEFAHPITRTEPDFEQLLHECSRFLNENFAWNEGATFSDQLMYLLPVQGDGVLPTWNSAAIDFLPMELREKLVNADKWAKYFSDVTGGLEIDGDAIHIPNVTQRPVHVTNTAAESILSQRQATELFQRATSSYATSSAVASALAAVGAYVPSARKGAATVLVTGAAAMVASFVWWGFTSISDLLLGESDSIAKLANQGLSAFTEVEGGEVRDIPRVVVMSGDTKVMPIVDGKSPSLEKAIADNEAGVYYMPRNMARQIVEQREPLLVQESRLVPASNMMMAAVAGLVGYAAFGWAGAAVGGGGVFALMMLNNYS